MLLYIHNDVIINERDENLSVLDSVGRFGDQESQS